MNMRAQTMAPASKILELNGLIVRKGKTVILKGIDWTVNRGEHWAILGANGCGKTSLLAALTAYLTPNGGTVELVGERYGEADWHEVRQQIGMVSSALTHRVPNDETALTTVLSGETAQLGYWTREENVDTSMALRCLGKLGIRHLSERPWGVLSQGERQKVFIARALVAQPQLLILDEPCSGLDPVARKHFLESIRTIAQKKKSPGLILVTHHVEEIIPEISHVLVLKQGKVLAAGTKAEVLKSSLLSRAFGAEIKIRRNSRTQGYSLSL
jgi:iron complex transport system ATP-binding protein